MKVIGVHMRKKFDEAVESQNILKRNRDKSHVS
jgi:hypothetical protein